jgi:hypothetical protein
LQRGGSPTRSGLHLLSLLETRVRERSFERQEGKHRPEVQVREKQNQA